MIHLICPMCNNTDMCDVGKPIPKCYKCLTQMELDPDFVDTPVDFEGWEFDLDEMFMDVLGEDDDDE